MPSMMIHLLTAHKICADEDPLFCIGTVAPDAISAREDKDITHFRTLKNREKALVNLALNVKCTFDEGVLLHLYLDWLWDNKPLRNYAETHTDDNWFISYRHEIALASSYIYHSKSWSEKVWQKMLSCQKQTYGKAPGASDGEVEAFVKRNYKWHSENNIGPSTAYSPLFVEEFTSHAAEKFSAWYNSIKVSNKDKIIYMGA